MRQAVGGKGTRSGGALRPRVRADRRGRLLARSPAAAGDPAASAHLWAGHPARGTRTRWRHGPVPCPCEAGPASQGRGCHAPRAQLAKEDPLRVLRARGSRAGCDLAPRSPPVRRLCQPCVPTAPRWLPGHLWSRPRRPGRGSWRGRASRGGGFAGGTLPSSRRVGSHAEPPLAFRTGATVRGTSRALLPSLALSLVCR